MYLTGTPIRHFFASPGSHTSPDPAPISYSANAEGKKMKNIFVGNLSFGATEADVRSLFEQYGTIERVNLITDRDTGQSRGFGFVEMSGNDEAQRAIAALDGRELNGRNLKVNEARPKEDRGFGGGGGGHRSNSGGGQRRQNRW
jgi:cold-inducible RNA-binding protein